MADRDVRLIIRAKDEASKAIDSVGDALRELTTAQRDAANSASGTGNLIGDLAAEFHSLQNATRGLGALGKVAGEIDKVKASVGSLQQETRRATADLAKSARDQEKAAASTAKLRTEVDRLEAEYRQQRAEADEARKATLKGSEATREMARAQSDLNRVMRRKTRTPAVESAQVLLAGELEKAKRVVAENAAAFDRLDKEAKQTGATLSDFSAKLREAERNERILTDQVESNRRALHSKRRTLNEARATLDEMDGTARKAAKALGGVAVEQEELARASQKATQELQEQNELLAATTKFSTGDGTFTDPRQAAAIRKQREEVERSRREYELLRANAERLRGALQGTVPATQAQVGAFRQAEAAARQARIEYDRQVAALNRLPGAMRNVTGLRGMFGAFYGESRQAMSLMQRLRGEVLSLATAYLGLYGAINNIGGVINAFQALEAAQNRLGAVFDQNPRAIANELNWIERQAARLGIEFGTLSQQYGKFAVAARAANFESSATRDVFLAVAEAGRVNKLSIDQLEGIFLALEQMISKGKVTSEELRRQLGDRLPGAFNIMADALGMTTAQLDDMMKKGQVLADQETLTAFADQLNRRFGAQLPESLRTTTTLLGRFANELFQAQLRVGEGGFIEALNEALERLITYFRSREGRDFFLSLGAALGNVTKVFALFADNLEIVISLIQVLIAFKMAQWVIGLAGSFRNNLLPELVKAQAAFVGVRGSMVAAGGGFTAAAAGARAFGAALRSIPAMFVLTGITFVVEKLLGNWIGGVDDATRSIDVHRQLMGEIISAYEEARDAAEDWKAALPQDTLTSTESNFITQMELYGEAVDALKAKLIDLNDPSVLSDLFNRAFSSDQVNRVRDLVNAFDSEDINGFIASIDELNAELTDIEAKKLLIELRDLAVAARESETRMGEAAVAAREMGSALPEVADAADDAGISLDDLTDATRNLNTALGDGTGHLESYGEAINKLMEGIPHLAREMEKAKEIAEVTAAYETAIANAAGDPNRIRTAQSLYDQNIAAINARYSREVQNEYREQYRAAREVNQALINTASSFMGMSENDPAGRDALRAFMSSANQDVDPKMIAWCAAFVNAVLASQGLEGTGKLNARSFLDYGTETDDPQPGDLVVLKRGNSNWQGHVGFFMGFDEGGNVRVLGGNQKDKVGVDSYRAQDVLGFRSVPSVADQDLANWQEATEEAEKQAEAAAKAQQATRDLISDKEFELAQAKLIAEGKGREAAIEAAIRQARQQNANITDEQIAKIRELTGALYDQQNAGEEVRLAEEKVNELYALRGELMEQLNFQREQGNQDSVDELKGRIETLDLEIQEAIDHAIQLMQALGGSGADLAIAKMENLGNSLGNLGEKALFSGEQITNMLASGLVNVFDKFAQAIANGEDAMDALWTAFRQFAADFLLQIAKMILQQALFNALQGFGGGLGGLLSGLFHAGGIAGQESQTRAVSPMWFRNAARYHEGGIAGIRPGEVPAILKVGEEILTEDDPRHRANGGAAGGDTKVINMFDAPSFLSASLASKVGEKAILNFVRANASAFRAALGT